MRLNKHTFWLLVFIFFNEDIYAQDNLPDVVGLLSPIIVQDTTTEIVLADYFVYPDNIVRVLADNSYKTTLSIDRKTLILQKKDNLPILSNLDIFTKNGAVYSILVKSIPKTKINFALKDDGYTNVSVVGDMNEWSGKLGEMKKDSDVWKATLLLNAGDYEYLFVADGVNRIDFSNPNTTSNGLKSKLHIPQPELKDLPLLFTLKHSRDSITLGVQNSKPDKIFIYVENSLILNSAHRFGGDFVFNKNTFKFKIPTASRLKKRTHIRIFSSNSLGESNDILIPLENGEVVDSSAQLDRSDAPTQIAYSLMVDRFNDGNKRNNKPIRDKRVHPMENWLGGDVVGIRNKINEGYFDSLNINTLFISPVARNPDSAFEVSGIRYQVSGNKQESLKPDASRLTPLKHWSTGYHGNWVTSQSEIDPHFGTESDMKSMVGSAHKKNLNVVLDYVAHHAHQESPLFLSNPEFFSPLELENGKKNVRLFDNYDSSTWFENFLPSFDYAKPEVVEMNSDTTIFWLKKYDLDGFNFDAANYISSSFWRNLTKKIKKEAISSGKQIYQIGETNTSGQMQHALVNSGMLDAQFDLRFYENAREALALDTTPMTLISRALNTSFNIFGYHSTFGNMVGNYNQSRFISLAGSALSFSEDAHAAGINRKIGVGNPIGYKRLQMATALMCAIPGVPVIYYGDEIGMPGAAEPDNRRLMSFKKLTPYEIETKLSAQKVTSLRRKRISLTYGDTEILLENQNALVLARTYFGEITIIAFNKGKKTQHLQFNIPWRFRNELFKSHFKNIFDIAKNEMTLQLKPVSFDFITN